MFFLLLLLSRVEKDEPLVREVVTEPDNQQLFEKSLLDQPVSLVLPCLLPHSHSRRCLLQHIHEISVPFTTRPRRQDEVGERGKP